MTQSCFEIKQENNQPSSDKIFSHTYSVFQLQQKNEKFYTQLLRSLFEVLLFCYIGYKLNIFVKYKLLHNINTSAITSQEYKCHYSTEIQASLLNRNTNVITSQKYKRHYFTEI